MQVVSRGTNDRAVEEFERLCGVIAQLFHVEQSPALAHVLSVSRQMKAKGPQRRFGAGAVPTKVGRFVPRGTQTVGFRRNLKVREVLRGRGCSGKGAKKRRDSPEIAKQVGLGLRTAPDTITEQ